MKSYENRILSRSLIQFLIGLVCRAWITLGFAIVRWKLKRRKIEIGKNVIIFSKAAKQLTPLFSMKSGVVSKTSHVDCRAPVRIGESVIIGSGVKILTNSHDVDSPDWTLKSYGIDIGDYVWIATDALILPSCRKIGRGAIIGAGSVVVRDVDPMAIVSGNPAKLLRRRKSVHDNLYIPGLFGGDFFKYLSVYLHRK